MLRGRGGGGGGGKGGGGGGGGGGVLAHSAMVDSSAVHAQGMELGGGAGGGQAPSGGEMFESPLQSWVVSEGGLAVMNCSTLTTTR